MKHPKLSFDRDAKKDVSAFFAFVGDAEYDGGRNLEWAVFSQFPHLKKMFDGSIFTGTKSDISKFVEDQYSKYGTAIEKNMDVYRRQWLEKESVFYSLTDDLFLSFSWPKGKYVAYPTIWGMYPRFLEDKTFQVPFKTRRKRYVNVIVAHEMLHFIFYEYFFRLYPQYASDEHDFLAWHVSEIFNTVVQNSPKWLKAFGLETMGYPEHEAIVERLSGQYGKSDSIETDALIADILSAVKNSSLV